MDDAIAVHRQADLRESIGLLRDMNDTAPHASPNADSIASNATPHAADQANPLAQHKTGFIVAFFAAIFMAVTAAVGTDVVPFGTRLAYWMIVMLTGATIGAGVTSGVQSWGRLRNVPWVEAALNALLISLPLTLAVVGTGMILLNMQRPSPVGLMINFGLVFLVSLAITAITYAIALAQKGKLLSVPDATAHVADVVAVTAQPAADSQLGLEQRFRDRLPHHLRAANLLALQSEDHYLRVHTDLGDTLILLRLSDAIVELNGVPGAQTHRSWWVARDAVLKSVRGDGKAILTLHGEIEAPVSRNYLKPLNDAGWFR
jgi:DNA-binding LytR/AlgR family response regulator